MTSFFVPVLLLCFFATKALSDVPASQVDVNKTTFGESLVMSCLFSDKFRSWERKKERNKDRSIFMCKLQNEQHLQRYNLPFDIDSVIYKMC